MCYPVSPSPAVQANEIGGLLVVAPNSVKVATNYTGRRPIVEDARCNVGRHDLLVRTLELAKPERVSAEIAARDGRLASHESSCVNGFRVFDLVGNVQEWVVSERAGSLVGALKGGRYNQGSIGCGRSIYVSDPWARYPHTGLRCCADPLAEAPTSP